MLSLWVCRYLGKVASLEKELRRRWRKTGAQVERLYGPHRVILYM
jgi:hypothetical protein